MQQNKKKSPSPSYKAASPKGQSPKMQSMQVDDETLKWLYNKSDEVQDSDQQQVLAPKKKMSNRAQLRLTVDLLPQNTS